ncbi:MAG: zinc ribbon domain-containing protein, partial [Actinobacteria bacterium]|nr:zinc ribbon domain-containing protein [Actinomycetota bacterium]
MTCPNCGFQSRPGAMFCGSCAFRLDGSVPVPGAAAPAPPPPARRPAGPARAAAGADRRGTPGD